MGGRKVPKSTWAAIVVAIFGLALIEGVVPIPGLEAHDTKEALSIVSDAVSDVVSTSVLSGEVVQTNPFEVLDSALSLPLESVTTSPKSPRWKPSRAYTATLPFSSPLLCLPCKSFAQTS